MKSKKVAAALAFFFGIWGVHRFYLGQRFLGVIHFFLFFIGMAALMDGEDVPLIALPAIIGFVDFILFLAMPQEDFDEKYNKKRLQQLRSEGRSNYRGNYQGSYRGKAPAYTPPATPTYREYKKTGVEKFRDFDFEGAIEDFEHALEFKYEDSATHFNLACCYSILEDAKKSFFHLELAISFGFNLLEKIHSHDALAFLRTQPAFDDFVRNGYKLRQELPAPQPDILSSSPRTSTTNQTIDTSTDLLEQIKKLGELRDKGILTDAEFAKQKKKILNN